MNNEIKEILKNIKKVANRETASRNVLMEMKDTDYQLLLDYITNLQQENERLKTKTKEQSLLLIDYQDMEQKLEDYKSRVEKAVEYIKKSREINYKTIDTLSEKATMEKEY